MKTIQIKNLKDDQMGALLECLRYAGVVSNIQEAYDEKKDRFRYSFEILPPKGVNVSVWQKMNVDRIKTFLINAE